MKNLKDCEERKKIEQADEMEKDMLIAIQEAAKDRLELMKKQRKYELEQQVIARRMAASLKMVAEAQESEEQERRIIEKAQAEWDRKEEAILRAKAEKAKKLREDRTKNYNSAMEEEQRIKQEEAEVKRWETMNRYKIGEYTKEYIQKKKEEEWKRVLQHREALKAQIAEREEREKQERDEDLEWFRSQICKEAEDVKFYEYAEEVLNTAKSRGRPTYPIQKIVEVYALNTLLETKFTSHMFQKYKKENALASPTICKKNSNSVVVPNQPGKMAYDPKTDPNYNKCKSNVDYLYSDN